MVVMSTCTVEVLFPIPGVMVSFAALHLGPKGEAFVQKSAANPIKASIIFYDAGSPY
jgi:hypothetical protein